MIYFRLEKELDKLAVSLRGSSLSDTTAKDVRTEETVMIDNLMGKGATFYYLGEYTKAISLFDAATNIKPDLHEALSNKGTALASLGRHEGALTAYDKAIDIKQDYENAWYNKACALSLMKEKDDAIISLQKAFEFGFNDLELLKNDKDLDFIRDEKEFQKI